MTRRNLEAIVIAGLYLGLMFAVGGCNTALVGAIVRPMLFEQGTWGSNGQQPGPIGDGQDIMPPGTPRPGL